MTIPTIRESKARLRKAGFGAFEEQETETWRGGEVPAFATCEVITYAGPRRTIKRKANARTPRQAKRLAYMRAAEAAERKAG